MSLGPNRHGNRSVVKNEFSSGKLNATQYETLLAVVGRKAWWHVPPMDPRAYKKRGKFFASSFVEAEFRDDQKISRRESRYARLSSETTATSRWS